MSGIYLTSMHTRKRIDLSIVIVSYNCKDVLADCLKAIYSDRKSETWEVIVVDSNSQDNPQELVKKFPRIIFIPNSKNIGFSKANNLGVRYSRASYILFLNPDTIPPMGSISQLLSFAQSENMSNLGAVSPMLLNKDGSIQPSCYHLPSIIGAIKEFWLGKKGQYLKYYPDQDKPTKIDIAVGACILMPRLTYDLIGGWDERYFIFFEDLEMGRQIKKKRLDFWYIPHARIVHLHGESTGKLPQISNSHLQKSSKIYFGAVKYQVITLIIWLAQKIKIIFQ